MKKQVTKKQAEVLLQVMPQEVFDMSYEMVTFRDEVLEQVRNNVVKDSKGEIYAFTIKINSVKGDGRYNDNKRLREICHVLNAVGEKVTETEYHYHIKDSLGNLFINLLDLAHFDN